MMPYCKAHLGPTMETHTNVIFKTHMGPYMIMGANTGPYCPILDPYLNQCGTRVKSFANNIQ